MTVWHKIQAKYEEIVKILGDEIHIDCPICGAKNPTSSHETGLHLSRPCWKCESKIPNPNWDGESKAAGPITANVQAGSATSEGLESKPLYGRVEEEEEVEPKMEHWGCE